MPFTSLSYGLTEEPMYINLWKYIYGFTGIYMCKQIKIYICIPGVSARS